jgi:mono/diheme cytochrome c family protein
MLSQAIWAYAPNHDDLEIGALMRTTTILATAGFVVALAAAVAAQHAGHGAPAKAEPAPGSRRVTMEELHNAGGIPRGWKFTLPAGDPAKGRKVFADLECYKCHVIEGAGFPPLGTDGKRGPSLTRMGTHHPAEYFAESILAPNNVIVEGPGYIGPDGKSIMPSFADSLSVTQLLDLVAFIKSQDGGGGGHRHGGAGTEERAAGPYKIRLEFRATGGGQAHGGGGAHARHAPSAAAEKSGHLMAFVTDAKTGDAIPYLPVSASVQIQGAPAKTVKLNPMMGSSGFHYGGEIALPAGTQKIVLSIGAATMQVMGKDAARFSRAQTVVFDGAAFSK